MFVTWGLLRSISRLLPLIFAIAAPESPAQSLLVEVNQNHTPAGVLRDGLLTIRLEVAMLLNGWHSDRTGERDGQQSSTLTTRFFDHRACILVLS
jgi:hypothetical protein